MLHFKDLFTELINPTGYCKNSKCKKIIAKAKNPAQKRKYKLVRQNVIEHYIEVAVMKEAASKASVEIGQAGSATPAPDYKWTCPICKEKYILDQLTGKFKYANPIKRIFYFQ